MDSAVVRIDLNIDGSNKRNIFGFELLFNLGNVPIFYDETLISLNRLSCTLLISKKQHFLILKRELISFNFYPIWLTFALVIEELVSIFIPR